MNFVEICKLPQEALKIRLENELKTLGYEVVNEDGFLYAEGDIPVMLTAHMDTVHHDNCTIVCTSEDGNVVMSPQGIGGDDRCGIYMCLKILQTHHCSVLFTEDEEIGCVGARKFCKTEYKPQSLNYIIEFDRKNADDAVFYSCANDEFEKFITTDTGFKTAQGSCSDISHVAPHLEVAAVNFSCGYYNPHTQYEYVKYNEMERNIQRAIGIIDKPCERFEYVKRKIEYTSYKDYKGSSYYSGLSDSYGYWGYHYNPETKQYEFVSDNNDKKENVSNSKIKTDYRKDYYEDDSVEDDFWDFYAKEYGIDDAPDWNIVQTINVMPLEPDEELIKRNDGSFVGVSDYEYYMAENGDIYYSGDSLYPLAYKADATAVRIYDDEPVQYHPEREIDIIVVSYEDWEAVNNYVEKLSEFDLITGTDYCSEYIEELYSYV